jgi:hypothetical protein
LRLPLIDLIESGDIPDGWVKSHQGFFNHGKPGKARVKWVSPPRRQVRQDLGNDPKGINGRLSVTLNGNWIGDLLWDARHKIMSYE